MHGISDSCAVLIFENIARHKQGKIAIGGGDEFALRTNALKDLYTVLPDRLQQGASQSVGRRLDVLEADLVRSGRVGFIACGPSELHEIAQHPA